MNNLAKKSKDASKALRGLNHSLRKELLLKLADHLEKRAADVIEANKKDLQYAEEVNLNQALKDRLMLNEDRIKDMASGVRSIAEQKEVVGEFYQEFTNEEGLQIKRQRVPLGVILMIFESRPNVVIDCAALALKSSNAIILKGGKEAKHSNDILGEIIQEALEGSIPKEAVQVLASDSREEVNALLELDEYIDVVIPRGGERLIEHVYKNAKMPVIAHFQGLCHMYIDTQADLEKAKKLVVNAKTQRTGVCNAIETLLVHKDVVAKFAPEITKQLKEKGCEVRADKAFTEASGENLKLATDEDWATEYLENILSIKTVGSLDDAIEHIDQYGSFHTECIVSEDEKAQAEFLNRVDASCVAVNASTRFNDGGQLGLGAELGISTTKFHAYGPMGAEQMTTSRYVIVGNGNTRG
ncbi:MAG: glutamate-5-semialdehyde dehydrogenase [Halobacteriovoraceae bacterium]|nr:glutamate-5-semialdehyde dehydrogenase [Halobacteriovoraceae bacterium]|tara:strand:- start:4763 stop:6001 length:1239 start_codon:yes stop_codon:yes gene_type:complete